MKSVDPNWLFSDTYTAFLFIWDPDAGLDPDLYAFKQAFRPPTTVYFYFSARSLGPLQNIKYIP